MRERTSLQPRQATFSAPRRACCLRPDSLIAYRVSRIAYRVSRIAYRVSRIAYRVSRIAYRVSLIAYRLSLIAYRVSLIAYRVSRIAYRLSLIAYRVSPIAYRLSRIAYRVSPSCPLIPIAFVSASAHRPDVNVRAHPAKPFGLFSAPEGGFADGARRPRRERRLGRRLGGGLAAWRFTVGQNGR